MADELAVTLERALERNDVGPWMRDEYGSWTQVREFADRLAQAATLDAMQRVGVDP